MNKQNNDTPPPWSEAPPWAMWRSGEQNGAFFWYSHKPALYPNEWKLPGAWNDFSRMTEFSHRVEIVDYDWKSTLEKRPSNE